MILKIIDENFLSAGSGDPAAAVSRIPTVFSAKRMKRFPWSARQALFPGTPCPGRRMAGISDRGCAGFLPDRHPCRISGILAENKIGIFVVSTYNTDYVLTKRKALERAMALLAQHGYTVLPDNPSHSTDDNSLRNAEREGVAEWKYFGEGLSENIRNSAESYAGRPCWSRRRSCSWKYMRPLHLSGFPGHSPMKWMPF